LLAKALHGCPELAVLLSVGFGYWVGSLKVKGFGLGPVTGSLIAGLVTGYFFDIAFSGTASFLLVHRIA